MDSLRDKVFYHSINEALNRLRNEMCSKHQPKKGNRFFTNGITYEISIGRLIQGGVQFEISSKIPGEILKSASDSEKYFKDIKKIMSSKTKKPADVKMENIIHSTNTNEVKERDYVKCTYEYEEKELYSDKEIGETVQKIQSGELDLSNIQSAATPAGKAVIYLSGKNTYEGALANVTDLISANESTAK